MTLTGQQIGSTAQLRNRERAIHPLQQAITAGYCDYVNLPWKLVPLRDDPEFQEIMRPKG